MSKKALGKGLQALLSDEQGEQPTIKEIPVTSIISNPDQPRKEFDQDALNELADSLRVHGLLQPILVKSIGDGRYSVIAGERRLRAARIAEFNKIAAVIQVGTEQEIAERALIENIQREELSPVEEGFAYARLIEEFGLTQETVAQRVGKGRTTIANLLRITLLPPVVLELLKEDKISLGHAKVLLGLKDTSLQVLAAQKSAKERLSVREIESLIGRLQDKPEPEKASARQIPRHSAALGGVEDRMRECFQTKVHIKGDLKKGKIEIQYFSEDELNRLLELWKIEIG